MDGRGAGRARPAYILLFESAVIEPFSATRRLIENRVPMPIAILWIAWAIAGAGALYLRAAKIIP